MASKLQGCSRMLLKKQGEIKFFFKKIKKLKIQHRNVYNGLCVNSLGTLTWAGREIRWYSQCEHPPCTHTERSGEKTHRVMWVPRGWAGGGRVSLSNSTTLSWARVVKPTASLINCLENIWNTNIWKITCLKEIGRQTPRFCKVIKGRDRRSLRSSHDSFSPEKKLFFISTLLWSTVCRIKTTVLHMLDTTEQSPSLSYRMFYFILCDCVCMWICPCHSAYVHIKGQLVGVSYFPLPCVFLGLNSGQRAWWQVPLPFILCVTLLGHTVFSSKVRLKS